MRMTYGGCLLYTIEKYSGIEFSCTYRIDTKEKRQLLTENHSCMERDVRDFSRVATSLYSVLQVIRSQMQGKIILKPPQMTILDYFHSFSEKYHFRTHFFAEIKAVTK